jgi:hypothetical protein
MAAMLCALALAAAAASAPSPPGGEGKLLEEVVAVVRTPGTGQTRVITLTRLAEEARIALVARGATRAASEPLDATALRAALEWLIDQTVLMDEVARLQVFEVERSEVLEELRKFKERFATPEAYAAFLRRLDLAEEELLVVLRRTLRVQRYLDSRVSRAARVGDAEVDAFYQGHRADFGGSPLREVREAVRRHLADERIQAEVRSIVAELRGRAEIRVLAAPDEAME